MAWPDEAMRTDVLRVVIIELASDATLGPQARGRDTSRGGGIVSIDLKLGAGDRIVPPVIGDTWWIHRRFGRWALDSREDLRAAEAGGDLPAVLQGIGTPEGFVTSPVGYMYLDLDGGSGTTLYVKESGTGSTGWISK